MNSLLLTLRHRFVLISLGLILAQSSIAQCVSTIDKLRIQFEEKGDFPSIATEEMVKCVEAWNIKQSRIDGFLIIARAYLKRSNIIGAETALRKMLAEDPNFLLRSSEGSAMLHAVFRRVRLGREVSVYSVSKADEPLEEAPATVILVTEEEIENRGYQSIEELLHDLPGFDISTGRGAAYSNIYQRGFRSNQTDHTLLLIDGVEMNDLSSHNAFVSRQYSMSNIKQVEVVYGPISNIYGANAFSGVINVITKDAANELAASNFGLKARATGGTWNTVSGEITTLFKSEVVSASVTGRVFQSDEMNHGDNPNWTFNPDDIQQYAEALRTDDADLISQILSNGASNYYELEGEALVPTKAGISAAQQLDPQIVPVPSFQNASKNVSLGGKLRVANFSAGFLTWKKEEGNIGWNNWQVAGTGMGNSWIVGNSSAYMKYEQKKLLPQNNLDMTLFARFKVHTVLPETRTIRFKSYLGGQRNLLDLINGVPSKWDTTSYYRISNQLRVELRGNYDLNWDLRDSRIMFGSELRSSQIQGDYITALNQLDFTEVSDSLQSLGNHFSYRDLGFFGESVFGGKQLKVRLGGRIDLNKAGIAGGFGTVGNVRASAIYKSKKYFVYKLMYSTAFKDASPFNRYSQTSSRVANPNLDPERIENLEGSVSFKLQDLHLQASVYQASVTSMIGLVLRADGSTQNQSIGEATIRGAQLSFKQGWEKLSLRGNYTFLDPRTTNSNGEMRIGDMATHRSNLQVNWDLYEFFTLNLRVNVVGKRPTGPGTSVPSNPNTFVPGYQTLNSTITYRFGDSQDFNVRLTLNNLLDQTYDHPGVRTAGNGNFAALLPQNRRNIHLSLSYDFGS